jgi:hypothetical protein
MKKKLILAKDRPSKHISIRIPLDVLDDLKRIAPIKGMGGYQALVKFYIGQGLRKDLEDLWIAEHAEKLESVLTECNVDPEQKRQILDRMAVNP